MRVQHLPKDLEDDLVLKFILSGLPMINYERMLEKWGDKAQLKARYSTARKS